MIRFDLKLGNTKYSKFFSEITILSRIIIADVDWLIEDVDVQDDIYVYTLILQEPLIKDEDLQRIQKRLRDDKFHPPEYYTQLETMNRITEDSKNILNTLSDSYNSGDIVNED